MCRLLILVKTPGSGPAAAGPSTGRDRVLAIRCSRSPQPTLIKDQKYTVGFEHTFAARGDPTSPNATTNGRKTRGYVGQAARPPRKGLFESLRLTSAGYRQLTSGW
jgi:hypothetical protein